jgi:hypothetical protein
MTGNKIVRVTPDFAQPTATKPHLLMQNIALSAARCGKCERVFPKRATFMCRGSSVRALAGIIYQGGLEAG